MKRGFKFFSLFIATLLFLSGFNFESLAKAKSTPLISISQYEKYLENYSKQDAINSGIDQENVQVAVDGASKQLKTFKALSATQKNQYLDYLANYEKIADDTQKMIDDASNSITGKTAAVPLSSSVHHYTVSETSHSFFNIIRYKVSLTYRVSNKKVTNITSSDAYVLNNYNPLIRTGLGHKSAYVTGGNHALLKARFYYRLGPVKGLSVSVGNVYYTIEGDKYGNENYSHLWKD